MGELLPFTGSAPAKGVLVQPELVTRFRNTFGGVTPDRVSGVLRQLQAGYCEQWADFTGHMVRTDPHLHGIYYTRRMAVAGVPWEVTAGQTSNDVERVSAQVQADFCRYALGCLDGFSATLMRILDAIGRGYSVHEIEWVDGTYAGKRVWLPRLHWEHPRRFRFVDRFRLQLWDSGARQLELAPTKWLVHLPSSVAEYPVDSGELLSVVWLWLLKTWGWKFWAAAAEKFGSPLAIGKVPRNSPAEVRRALLDALENLSSDHAAVIEEGDSIDVVEPKAGITSDIFAREISMINAEMSKGILGASDLAESSEDGSRAATEVRNTIRLERAQADAAAVASTIRKQLFAPLLEFNTHVFGGGGVILPTLRFRVGEERAPIPQSLIEIGGVTVNEMRISAGLAPWSAERGGDERVQMQRGATALPQTQPAQPAQPAQPTQPTNTIDPTYE